VGVAGAVVLRILFAVMATQLLTIVGLTLAGGILLLWVCWKMYREIQPAESVPALAIPSGTVEAAAGLSFGGALLQIVVADVSMSLDNVLAVAGAAKGDFVVLAIGLVVAVAFMGLMSAYIAKLLAQHPWISWIGLLVILYVAMEMIWSGGHQVACHFVAPNACEAGGLATFSALLSSLSS